MAYGGIAKAKSLTINAAGRNVQLLAGTNDLLKIYGDIILQSGTLESGNGTITLQGDWVNSGGNFTAQNSTVVYNKNGGTQNIGVAPYYNLTLDSSGQKTAPADTLSIKNDFTIQNSAVFAHNNGTVNMSGTTGAVNAVATVRFLSLIHI